MSDEGAIGDPNNSGQDTSDSDDWRTVIPEQFRDWTEVQEAPDLETYFKSVGELRSLQGRSLVIPTEERPCFAAQIWHVADAMPSGEPVEWWGLT